MIGYTEAAFQHKNPLLDMVDDCIYTFGITKGITMTNIKTAVSIQEPVFEQAEKLARELNLSRSSLYTLALEAFIERYQNKRLLREINAAYETDDSEDIRLRRTRRA